jgi:hypothetical protein
MAASRVLAATEFPVLGLELGAELAQYGDIGPRQDALAARAKGEAKTVGAKHDKERR